MRLLLSLLMAFVMLALAGAGGLVFLFEHYDHDLPDYTKLANYEPPVTTRIYAGDGRLMAEFASERRIFVPIDAMPRQVMNAFMAAEDKNFYGHQGVDPIGILRAILTNVENFGRDRRPVGASTITQQVAKNMLLTNEVSFARKIKEAILAIRIERTFTKDRILELYLNEIFLGNRSYGVAAAALNYFNKALDELSIEEVAFLAALPKAPSNYNPDRQHDAAVARRNWVIGRMAEDDAMNHSKRFATLALQNLGRDVPLIPNRPHRQAGFAVLTAPDVPSALIEMGYLSNQRDIKLLTSSGHRERLGKGLARTIDAYFRWLHGTQRS